MKKIVAFAGSTSPQSINQQLVKHAISLIHEHAVTLIDLRDYPLPIFNIDIEPHEGFPENAQKLWDLFASHDAFIISVAEHTSSMTAHLKNMLDWVASVTSDYQFLNNKPVLLLSASPNPGGGKNALLHAEQVLTTLAGKVVGKVSIPNFYTNMQVDETVLQIKSAEISKELAEQLARLAAELSIKPVYELS